MKKQFLTSILSASLILTSVAPMVGVGAEENFIANETFDSAPSWSATNVNNVFCGTNGKYSRQRSTGGSVEWSDGEMEVKTASSSTATYFMLKQDSLGNPINITNGVFEIGCDFALSQAMDSTTAILSPLAFIETDEANIETNGNQWFAPIKLKYNKIYYTNYTGNNVADKSTSDWVSASTNKYVIDSSTIINPNDYYNLKLIVDIDGDETTFDTYSYVLTNKSTGDEYAGGPYRLGTSFTGAGGQNEFDLKGIKAIGTVINSGGSAGIKIDNFYYKEVVTMGIVESSVENGAKDVPISGEITVKFNENLDENSLEGTDIYVGSSAEGQRALANVSVEKGNTLKIEYNDLNPMSQYSLIIPGSISTTSGSKMGADKVISFTTDSKGYAYFDDFVNAPAWFNIANALTNPITADYARIKPGTVAGAKVEKTAVDYMALESGVRSSGADDVAIVRLRDSEEAQLSITNGSYETGTSFMMPAKISDTDKASFMFAPIAYMDVSETKIENNSNRWIAPLRVKYNQLYFSNYAPKTTQTATNNCYVTEGENVICDIEEGHWYDVKLNINTDADSTTFDTYTYTVKDKTTGDTYAGGPYYLGSSFSGVAAYHQYDLTKLIMVCHGIIDNPTKSSYTINIDNIYTKKLPQPKVTVNVENGAENVDLYAPIKVVFDTEMNTDTYSFIKLYRNVNGEIKEVPFKPVTTSTTFEIPQDVLGYSSAYRLIIPNTVSSVKNVGCEAKTISFTTGEMPAAIDINNIVVNNGQGIEWTKGSDIKVSADFKNKGIYSSQPATMIAAIFDDGRMKAVAFTRTTIELNGSKNLTTTLQVPEITGTPSLKLFVWDNFTNMTAMSNVIDITE